MSTKVFKQGIALTSVSADPSSPKDGELQLSDGTSRAAGYYRYDAASSTWKSLGGGAGSLDIFHQEDFESTKAADIINGNQSAPVAAGTGTLDGTLADETSTPLSADSSLKYTMGSTSANDYFLNPEDIVIDEKQTNNHVGISFYYTYNGDDDDIRFVVLDQDDVELTDSIQYIKSNSTATRFSTAFYIPDGVTGLRYGFQVVTGNSAKIFIVDDVEISTNPFVYKQLSNDTDWTSYTPTTQGLGTPTNVEFSYKQVGDAYFIQGRLDAGTTTADEIQIGLPNSKSVASSVTTVRLAGTSARQSISDNDPRYVIITGGDTYLNLSRNDGSSYNPFQPRTGSTFIGSGQTMSLFAVVPIEGGTATTEHVVTPATSTSQALSFNGLGSAMTSVSTGVLRWGTINDSGDGVIEYDDSTGRFTALKECYINTSVAIRSGTLMNVNINKNGTSVKRTTSGINQHAEATFHEKLEVGDYVDFETASGLTTAQNQFFSMLATPAKVNFLSAIPTQQVAYVKDVKSSGTAGGTFTSGSYQTRTLNTLEGDTGFISLSSNQFTLPAGKYIIEAFAPVYKVNKHKLKVYNITDVSDEIVGMSHIANPTGDNNGVAHLQGMITISSSKTYELQHRCSTTRSTDGYGLAATFGEDEVYAQVKITKLS